MHVPLERERNHSGAVARQISRVHPAQRRSEREGGRARRLHAHRGAAAVRLVRGVLRRGRPARRRAGARRVPAGRYRRAAVSPAVRPALPRIQRMHGLLTDRSFVR